MASHGRGGRLKIVTLLKISSSACMCGCCMVFSAARVVCIAPAVNEIVIGVCESVPVSFFVCVSVRLPGSAYVFE